MERYTLTYVQRYPKTSAAGKLYTSLVVKTNTHGDKTLSGFGNKDNEHWKVGDEVEFEVEQKGQYLNFTTPKATRGATDDHTKARIEQIYQEVFAIRQILTMRKQQEERPSYEYPEGPNGEPDF